MIKNGIFIVYVLLLLLGCTSKKVYENQSGRCRLVLYGDSTYKFKYPTLIRARHDKGVYTFQDSSILLKRVVQNTFDSIEYSSSYLTERPSAIKFSFKGLNDTGVVIRFSLNGDTTVFRSDVSGTKELLYSDLLSKKIISADSTVNTISIFYHDKKYTLKDPLRKPTDIDIRLNQFIGEKNATLYTRFAYRNDTITVSGVDPKVIGSDRKLTRK
jgi:hypothetical protein